MDKKSIAVGVILSLIAQGLYNTMFYFMIGEHVDAIASLFVLYAIIPFSIGVFSYFGYFNKRKAK